MTGAKDVAVDLWHKDMSSDQQMVFVAFVFQK